METEVLLPCLQEHATCLYLEPRERLPSHDFKSILILYSYLRLSTPSDLIPSCVPTETYHLLYPFSPTSASP